MSREATGAAFDPALMIAARERSIRAVEQLTQRIKPGLSEDQAQALATQCFAELGLDRIWHPTHIRFGRNTTKLYNQRSEPDVVLGKSDLYFVDIGPVYEGHEGDYGDTFVVGDDPEHHQIAAAARTLFDEVADCWRNEGLSGVALYERAQQLAQAMGYELNLGAPGHRLGDYPHSVHKAGKLADLDHRPSPGLWVLEIQIRHRQLPIGAFFEDLLGQP